MSMSKCVCVYFGGGSYAAFFAGFSIVGKVR